MLLSTASCAPTIGFAKNDEWCADALKVSFNEIAKSQNIDTVLIASSKYTYKNDNLSLLSGYKQAIVRLQALNKRVIFFIDPIGLPMDSTYHGYDPEACVISENLVIQAFAKRVPEWCNGVHLRDYHFSNERGLGSYYELINQLQRDFSNVIFYDPNNILCRDQVCTVFNNGELLYEDFGHLSIYGSKYLADDFIKKNPFLNKP